MGKVLHWFCCSILLLSFEGVSGRGVACFAMGQIPTAIMTATAPGSASVPVSSFANDTVRDGIVDSSMMDKESLDPNPRIAAQQTNLHPLVYLFPIREEIMPAAWRLTQKCLADARERGADYIVIDLNTYGGMVDVADSIRTALLNSPIPVWIFINNQAASAGALISLAADRIYMRSGGSIGAATVVDQSGKVQPDKYQSFMRGMMRATAESHGKVLRRDREGRETMVWFRDPHIAEAMVDPTVVVPGLVDSTKVLTLTVQEALKWGFCEGEATSVQAILQSNGLSEAILYEYVPTRLDRLMGFLSHPMFRGLMLMLIIGGLYFELQSPGIGFPLALAVFGALLYFAPLYFEGLLQAWELVVFGIGVLLLGIELFAIPGFGVAGVTGIVLMVTGLGFAMIDNDVLKYVARNELSVWVVLRPFFLVIISGVLGLVVAFWLGARFLTGESPLRKRVVLTANLDADAGFVGQNVHGDAYVGRVATVTGVLRPGGKVRLGDRYLDAVAEDGAYLEAGTLVVVTRVENGTLYCRKK